MSEPHVNPVYELPDPPTSVKEWKKHIYTFLAGLAQSGDIEEATGFDPDDLTDTNYARVKRALDEVITEMYRKGR